MAKATKSSVDDLNAENITEEDLNVDDLNAGGGITDNQQNSEKSGPGLSDDKGSAADDAGGPDFVVLKGNCIRHDGEVYRENMRIPVSGKDAERLLSAGVIADTQLLRQRALSAVRGVKITTE